MADIIHSDMAVANLELRSHVSIYSSPPPSHWMWVFSHGVWLYL